MEVQKCYTQAPGPPKCHRLDLNPGLRLQDTHLCPGETQAGKMSTAQMWVAECSLKCRAGTGGRSAPALPGALTCIWDLT